MIYFNGKIISTSNAHIDPSDRGILLGDGIFETMRVNLGKILFVNEHLTRLWNSANFLELKITKSKDQIIQALQDTLKANDLINVNAALRLTLTRGTGPRGLIPSPDSKTTIIISAVRLPIDILIPAKAIISSIPRNEFSPLANIKSLNYLDNILARKEAGKQNMDEAIMLNTSGNLAEATTANLFIIRQKHLYTPKLEDGALPGITRDMILQIAKQINISATEKTLQPDALHNADEAFLTNSLIGIRPLIEIDFRAVGRGIAGPITEKFSHLYNISAK